MPEKSSIRLAVVGAGPSGQRHLQAIASAPGCQAVAVVDPTPLGAEVAERWGVEYFTDQSAMLEAVRPDGVINATPNNFHGPLTLDCIARGIPVLLEKPIADTLENALAIVEASERSGVPVLVGHHRRHNPIIARARELVQSGALGRLTAVNACWLLHKPDNYYDVAWRRQAGGGPILINLIHDIDNLRFIAGEIAGVRGITSNERRAFAVEDTAAMLLRFADGALGTVLLSDTVAAPWSWELTAGERSSNSYPRTGQDCYFLAGTEGALAVPSLRHWRYDGAPDWRDALPETSLAVPDADPMIVQAGHFADVTAGRAEPLITARDATRSLEVTLAVGQSASGEIVLTV